LAQQAQLALQGHQELLDLLEQLDQQAEEQAQPVIPDQPVVQDQQATQDQLDRLVALARQVADQQVQLERLVRRAIPGQLDLLVRPVQE
jgi:hypothetical protein